ncbi:MAG: hypothetical protein V7784_04710 [Oceanospirillaceae bacterium]
MHQRNGLNSHSTSTRHCDLLQPQYCIESIDAYQLAIEKELLLNFLATWKDRNLTEQQAVEQLNTLMAKATPAPNAQAAHQMQMELLAYASSSSAENNYL